MVGIVSQPIAASLMAPRRNGTSIPHLDIRKSARTHLETEADFLKTSDISDKRDKSDKSDEWAGNWPIVIAVAARVLAMMRTGPKHILIAAWNGGCRSLSSLLPNQSPIIGFIAYIAFIPFIPFPKIGSPLKIHKSTYPLIPESPKFMVPDSLGTPKYLRTS